MKDNHLQRKITNCQGPAKRQQGIKNAHRF